MTNQKGFTMVELLTVVIIVAVLTAVALPQYTKSVERARATEAMNLVKNINDAIYAYAAARSGDNICPDSFHKLIITLPVKGGDNSAVLSTPNFTYNLQADWTPEIPGTPCHGVTATRRNGGTNYDYVIWNPYEISTGEKTITLACYSPSNKAASQEVCQSLGIFKQP